MYNKYNREEKNMSQAESYYEDVKRKAEEIIDKYRLEQEAIHENTM